MLRFFARLLFYPTLWWNVLLNRFIPSRRWWDWIDDDVLLGALPSPRDVARLKDLGIGAVVNTCDEYPGPLTRYHEAGMEQLHIPTVDFTPPKLEDLVRSVDFVRQQIKSGKKVYIHCKAGRGRSATVAMCYLITKGLSPDEAQRLLLQKRAQVLPVIHKREVVRQFSESWKANGR